MKAPHFSTLDYAAIEALSVLPPLESRDKSITWARGSIWDSSRSDLIITGPRLPVLYSGCRYNNMVFSMHGPADEPSYAFESFLHKVLSHVESSVSSSVEKYRPGTKNAALLQFERDFIRPSSYSSEMPNEMRVKLLIARQADEHGEIVDMIESKFETEDGTPIDPQDIRSGSEIVPIMRVGYFRNGSKFGLNLTLLKGLVYPSAKRPRVSISELEFDVV